MRIESLLPWREKNLMGETKTRRKKFFFGGHTQILRKTKKIVRGSIFFFAVEKIFFFTKKTNHVTSGPMRGLKNCNQWHKHTDRYGGSIAESAQWC